MRNPQPSWRHTRLTSTVLGVTVIAGLFAGLSGCSRSYDTTQVDATGNKTRASAPSTSMVVETVPSTTIAPVEPIAQTASDTDLQSTLSQLVAGFASDPTLVNSVKALSSGDLADIAELFGIDIGALTQLGMSVGDIGALGDSVAANGAGLLAGVLGSAGSAAGSALGTSAGALLDPATLIGLLMGAVDINGLTQGAITQVIGGLFATLSGSTFVLTPDVTIELGDLLGKIDPNTFNDFQVNPDNAAIIALITSVVLANNPLLQQGLLNSPGLNPQLKELLDGLQDLNAILGNTASDNIFKALQQLFPWLTPQP